MVWRPDTCACVIEADFSTGDVQGIRPCRAHRHLPPAMAFAAVRAENTLKNRAYAAALSVPDLVEGEGDERRLRDGVEFTWTFDEGRALAIEMVGASEDESARVAGAVTLSLPPGARVRVRGRA